MIPSEKEITLERKSKEILSYLKTDLRHSDFFPRPFIIEFGGSPSSGKSSTIDKLDEALRRQGFRVWTPQEGAKAIRYVSRSTPLYNLRTGVDSLIKLIDESQGDRHEIVIFDRSIFDSYCWMSYWAKKGLLSPNEVEMFQSFFTSRFWSPYIDISYFMICDPRVAIGRENKVKSSDKTGQHTNPETIRLLIDMYREAHQKLSPTYNIRLIDTTDYTQQEIVDMIKENIILTLAQKVKEIKKEAQP